MRSLNVGHIFEAVRRFFTDKISLKDKLEIAVFNKKEFKDFKSKLLAGEKDPKAPKLKHFYSSKVASLRYKDRNRDIDIPISISGTSTKDKSLLHKLVSKIRNS